MRPKACIAADFGGGSGRVIAGCRGNDGALVLDEVHRFANNMVEMGGHVYWDFPNLFRELIVGLKKSVDKGYEIASIGVDTWGVDFGLVDKTGNLLGNPVSYRCPCNDGCSERFFASGHDRVTHYSQVGVQIMDINSLYRLCEMKEWAPDMLKIADKLLFMPDLFSYFLTGNANVETTIASTSELLNPLTRQWNWALIRECGLPERLFGDICSAGEVRGCLTVDVKRMIGVDYDVPVVAVGSHDTASAIYSCGAGYGKDGDAFLSSGTWSLLGFKSEKPMLGEEVREGGFTNEAGADGAVTVLQNITGLWIMQRLGKEWDDRGEGGHIADLIDEAERSDYRGTIDVDSPSFANPQSMENAIRLNLKEKGAILPATRADFTRCVMESLAERYARGIDKMHLLTGARIKRLYVIGGGSRNRLLNRLTAEKAGVEVIAGPAEATAIGNIMLQMKSVGM